MTVTYLLMVQKRFKTKDSMIVPNNLCLGNVSKDFSASNMKKTGFNGDIYEFSVDFDSIDVDDIKDIYKYLMKKNNIVLKMFRLIKANISISNNVSWL